LQCCPCTLFSSARCTPSPDKEEGRTLGLRALLHDAAAARLEAIEEILQLAIPEVKLNPETGRVGLLELGSRNAALRRTTRVPLAVKSLTVSVRIFYKE
jgi:hypothetical protein